MNTNKLFDDFEDDKYFKRKKGKMKTLRTDDQYGSIFEKQHKLKNIDPSVFDNEDDYDEED